MYYFTKKVRCMDCGKFYKGKKERKERIVLECSGYSNYGKLFCSERWKLDQDFLLDLLYDHHVIELIKTGKIDGTNKKPERVQVTPETLLSNLATIEVSPTNKTLRIEFNDGTSTFITENQHSYFVE